MRVAQRGCDLQIPILSACSSILRHLMTLHILLFATLKEFAPDGQLSVEVPANATVADVWDAAIARAPALGKWRRHARVAVNQCYASETDSVPAGAEIALIPPVSGGAQDEDEPFVEVRATELSLDEVVRAVQSETNGRAGAICTFLGVVRANSVDPDGQKHDDIEFLDYEAYEPMAAREMRAICLQVRQDWDGACAITHRTGRLNVGEASVAIAVATPHRAASFEACRFAIETLKKQVPIWKKETARDGFWWVEGA